MHDVVVTMIDRSHTITLKSRNSSAMRDTRRNAIVVPSPTSAIKAETANTTITIASKVDIVKKSRKTIS